MPKTGQSGVQQVVVYRQIEGDALINLTIRRSSAISSQVELTLLYYVHGMEPLKWNLLCT
jgi:hypothetical protein